MYMKASVSAILYKSKVLANGEHPIMLRVCYNGKRAYKSLKLSCSMKFWNEETSEVKSKHPYSINMNAIINQELSSLKALVLDYERTGTPYSAKILVEKISKPQLVTKTLLQLIDERVQYFKNEKGKYNTATGYRTLYNLVKKYVLRDIELFEVNRDWLKDFENFIRKTNKRETSIYKHFCTLKAVFNFAIKEGLLNEDKNPFKNFEQHLDRRTKKRALTFAEILKLMIYFQNKYSFVYPSDFEIHEGLILPPKNVKPIHTDDDEDIDVRKYWNAYFKKRGVNKVHPLLNSECVALSLFLSSYLMQGLALIDLANLKWKDIRILQIPDNNTYYDDVQQKGYEYAENHKLFQPYYEINIVRRKTSKPLRIIIDAYVFTMYLSPFLPSVNEFNRENYVFGIFEKNCTDEGIKFSRMAYLTYLVNVNLKRIAKKIGIDENITFYSARHTYASMLYHGGVSISLIAQNMGRDVTNIETYLKEFDESQIINANSLIWNVVDPKNPLKNRSNA